jgi:hypothetical protein
MLDPTAFGYRDFGFSWGDHICAIFDDHDQQMEIMGAFIATGLRNTQRCVWVAPADSSAALRRTLTRIGGDLPTLEASSQLVIISEVEFYLQKGVFEPNRTMDLVGTLLEDGDREGYRTMRIANDVSWLREDRISAETWERFESQLTEEVRDLPLVMVCQYDRRQVSGDIIVAAFRTHPIVIMGDTMRRNPFHAFAAAAGGDSRDII